MADSASSVHRSSGHSQRMVSPVLRVALLLGVLVHLAGFLIFKVVSTPLPSSEPNGAFVQFLSNGTMAGDADLEEQAILFDSAPLFIPTKWNTSSQIFAAVDGPEWQFPDFEPAIDLLADLEPSSRVLDEAYSVSEPVDLLALRYWKFFEDFTSASYVENPLPATGSFAEIYFVDQSGGRWDSVPIVLEYAGATAREPVDYYLRIDGNTQGIGRPRLSTSSGNESFDQAALEWLERPAVQFQLPAGYLLIRIFP